MQLQDLMLHGSAGDHEMVNILALVLHHDEQAVLVAVEMALAEGVVTKTHMLNLLHRLIDRKMIVGSDYDTPQARVLHCEPKANAERYDGLRIRHDPSQTSWNRAHRHFLLRFQCLPSLLQAEPAEREVRSIAYRRRAARVTACKDLSGFDFAGR